MSLFVIRYVPVVNRQTVQDFDASVNTRADDLPPCVRPTRTATQCFRLVDDSIIPLSQWTTHQVFEVELPHNSHVPLLPWWSTAYPIGGYGASGLSSFSCFRDVRPHQASCTAALEFECEAGFQYDVEWLEEALGPSYMDQPDPSMQRLVRAARCATLDASGHTDICTCTSIWCL